MATRKFYEKNELVNYAETEDEVRELALKLPMGAEIEMNGEDEFKYFIVNSNHEPKEI